MTILTELTWLYDRRAEAEGWPRPGFSTENIGAEIVLDTDGGVLHVRPLDEPDAKGKLRPRRMAVPTVSRTSGIRSALFWDKTAYALGVTAAQGPDGKPLADEAGAPVPGERKRTAREHAAFREAHATLLAEATSPPLVALRRFVEAWRPERFMEENVPPSIIDRNVVFRFGEDGPLIYETPEAGALLSEDGADMTGPCLVTGEEGPIAKLHPKIKGVAGAQGSGAYLVAFNAPAFESHGQTSGENAPVSDHAATAYGTALNALLTRGSGNNLRMGDATVAFWAEGAGEAAAENAMGLLVGGGESDAQAEGRLAAALQDLAAGKPGAADLHRDTRFFVLGLAPNAARISVRFWHVTNLGDLARNIAQFWADCAVNPSPFRNAEGQWRPPKPWALLYDLAQGGKAENIPPGLGGAFMRAILTGTPYPRTLLSGVIGRLRAEPEDRDRPRDQIRSDGRRAALIRAVLTRAGAGTKGKEVPMALDEEADDVAYLLGRLFGAYVYAERSYKDRGASLRDKYMGSASATPARVFPVLMRGYEHNLAALSKAGGQKAGAGVVADKAVSRIIAALPGGGDLPAALPIDDQGRFFVGFYHQLSAFYAKPEEAAETLETGDAQ